MTHKVIVVGKEFPYYGSTVPFAKSVNEIKRLLQKARGVVKVGEMTENIGGDELTTLMIEVEGGAQFLIEFPVVYLRPGKGKQPKLAMQISGRAMFFHIKDMLTMAEMDFLSITQAFSPYLALPDVDGKPRPLKDFLPDKNGVVQSGRPLIPYLSFETKQIEDKRRGVQ